MLKELPPITPLSFFNLSAEIFPEAKRGKKLPRASELLGEEAFADLALYWSPHELVAIVNIAKVYEEGDAVELFIDTRDLKSSAVVHRFCHHFIFYPESIEGVQAQEITRFRSDDAHPLCSSDLLHVKSTFQRKSYEMRITMPKEVLNGYHPSEFNRLGFTYRISRKVGSPQHFALSSNHYSIERHPNLWASLICKELS